MKFRKWRDISALEDNRAPYFPLDSSCCWAHSRQPEWQKPEMTFAQNSAASPKKVTQLEKNETKCSFQRQNAPLFLKFTLHRVLITQFFVIRIRASPVPEPYQSFITPDNELIYKINSPIFFSFSPNFGLQSNRILGKIIFRILRLNLSN
jgi:hypothetical protein